jgi:hypothetical protein
MTTNMHAAPNEVASTAPGRRDRPKGRSVLVGIILGLGMGGAALVGLATPANAGVATRATNLEWTAQPRDFNWRAPDDWTWRQADTAAQTQAAATGDAPTATATQNYEDRGTYVHEDNCNSTGRHGLLVHWWSDYLCGVFPDGKWHLLTLP